MASPIAIDHRRVHSESGLFIGEEVVCLQTDIDEGIIKTSKLDIDNDSNIINIDHGNGDVELSISCSTTDGPNINDIISKGEEDGGGGSELMSIVTSYDVYAEEEQEKAMSVDTITSTATESRHLTLEQPTTSIMSPSSKILRNLRQKIACKVKIAKNRMIPTSPAFSTPLTPLSPKAKLTLATSNFNSTVNKEKENEGTNSESTCDMTHIDQSEEDENSSSGALPTSPSVVQQQCTKEEPTLNTSSNESDESTNSRSTKSSTNTRESSREIESTSSSITVSTCDFGSINGNHNNGGKLNEHAIFENYLLTSPWEAAKNGDYSTLSYIVNHENDVNIWIQKDEEGHVPLYYACTSYNNYKHNSGKYGLECIKLLLRVWPLEHLPTELLRDNTGNNEKEKKKGITAESSNYDTKKKIQLHGDVLEVLCKSTKSKGQLNRHKTAHRYSPGLELPEIKEQTSSLSDGGIVVEGVSEHVVALSFLEDLGDDGYVEDY